ncbi:transmembrane protein, putative, partial [Bodo saltans]
ASARSLRLPSALLPLLTAVVPSTASSATLLLGRLRSSACVEVDVVLALLGILISLLPCATFVLLWGVKVSSHQWVCTSLAEGRKSSDVSGPIQRLYNTLRRDYQWSVASAQTCTANEELMPAWVILLEFRDLRYGIVDLAVLAGVSCLSVVSGLTASSAQCRGWSFVVLLLLTLQLTALVTARRLTTLFSTVYCATSLCLTIISSLAQLIFVWSYSADTSALRLVDVSAGCSLAVVGLSAINMIVDGIGLLSAVKRRWRSLLEQQDATSNETNIDTDPDRLPLNQLLQEKTTSGDILEFGDHIVDHDDKDDSLEEILLPESDHLFWDSAGGAVGTGLVDERSDIMQVVTSFRHNLR